MLFIIKEVAKTLPTKLKCVFEHTGNNANNTSINNIET